MEKAIERAVCIKEVADTLTQDEIVKVPELSMIGSAIFCDQDQCVVCYDTLLHQQHGSCTRQQERLNSQPEGLLPALANKVGAFVVNLRSGTERAQE